MQQHARHRVTLDRSRAHQKFPVPLAQTALAQRYNCSIESSQSALTDWVVLLRADTLVMASSTFCYFQVSCHAH